MGEVRGDVGKVWGKIKEGGGEEVWGRYGRVYGESVESVGKCVGVWGGERRGMGDVGKVRGDRSVGKVWESVWGECGKVCWGVGRTANSKELDHLAELELELEKIFFLNSNLNSHITVRVH